MKRTCTIRLFRPLSTLLLPPPPSPHPPTYSRQILATVLSACACVGLTVAAVLLKDKAQQGVNKLYNKPCVVRVL